VAAAEELSAVLSAWAELDAAAGGFDHVRWN
jgi:hypothetical protein